MPEEVKFPLTFSQCPNCGSERKVAKSIVDEEIAAGKLPWDTKGIIMEVKNIYFDPNPKLVATKIEAPAVRAFMDICADCGTFYCVYAEKGKVQLQGKIMRGQPPPGQSPFGGGSGPFPFIGKG